MLLLAIEAIKIGLLRYLIENFKLLRKNRTKVSIFKVIRLDYQEQPKF